MKSLDRRFEKSLAITKRHKCFPLSVLNISEESNSW